MTAITAVNNIHRHSEYFTVQCNKKLFYVTL